MPTVESPARFRVSRLRRLLTRQLAGFAAIGAFTFALDLGLLTLLRQHTALPLPAAVSLAYLVASAVNFVLNRTLNFHSHAPVGAQIVRYAVVLAADYLLTVGVSTGLTALGGNFAVARVAASFLVAVFTYSASRWWVFRPAHTAAVEPSGRYQRRVRPMSAAPGRVQSRGPRPARDGGDGKRHE